VAGVAGGRCDCHRGVVCGRGVQSSGGGCQKCTLHGPNFGGLVRVVRLAVGPLAEGLVVLGNVVTPGVGGTATVTSENQFRNWVDEATAQDMLEEEDRELLHSVF
jgi:hypothetical protein